ncbi:ricin-type beta-trefoil lectin domain protein [Leifsonia sp. A12D58]|uniref:ricin-type beta-trefoil lectin domain protein n=1 Tax=Leifsonia sp. A12D58 TaxID=3397674 RepID=UPI0039DFF0D7
MAIGTTVFLTLVGTAGASALWTTPAVSLSATVSSGAVGVTQSGFSALAVTYNATVRSTTRSVTVTNSGTITAPFTLVLGTADRNGLATGTVVRTWESATCTANAQVPGNATSSGWTTIPALTGTLAAGGAKTYCVRTTISPAQQSSLAGMSVAGTLTLTSAIGNWSSSATAAAIQTVLDTDAPTAPGAPVASATTSTGTTLTWTASTDNVGVVVYEIYRGTTLAGTSATLSFTDSGLTPVTAYSYTIKAKDAAGNSSAASSATSVTTKAKTISPNSWYKIVNPGSSFCLDGNEENTTSGVALIVYGCHGGTNQNWKFQADGKILAQYAPLYMRPVSAANNAGMELASSGARQVWSLVATDTDGQFQIQNVSTGRCLDVGTSPRATSQVVQNDCNATSSAQRFTMTEMVG